MSFEHRFYGADAETAEEALRDRATGQPPAGGIPFLHGNQFESLPEAQVVSRFGAAFATELFDAPTGDWRGPSNSAFGVHLWRPIRRTEARLPPLESIRTRVLQDWRESETERLLELRIDRLVQEYSSVTQDSAP